MAKTIKFLKFQKRLLSYYNELDRGIASFNSKIVCHKGCIHCCGKAEVYAQPIEAANTVYFLNAQNEITAELKEVIAANIRLFDLNYNLTLDKSRPNFKALIKPLKTACPFLINGSCIIYPVRPFICRSYISYSEDECKGEGNPVIMEREDFKAYISAERERLCSIEAEFISSCIDYYMSRDRYIGMLPREIDFKDREFMFLFGGKSFRIR